MDADDPIEPIHSLQSLNSLNSNDGDLSALVIAPTPQATVPQQLACDAKDESVSELPPQVDKEESEKSADGDAATNDANDDDDFGDFGNFASTTVEMFPASNEGETRFSHFSAHLTNQDVKNGINQVWTVLEELESRPESKKGLIKDKNNIVPLVTDKDWVKLTDALVNDTVFSENGGGRLAWRRSIIRQKFLDSLNISITKKNPPVSQVPTTPEVAQEVVMPVKENIQKDKPKNTKNQPLNDREKDLIEAKKLCDFSEEELRKKPIQELESLLKNMQAYHQKMYEQANYWLDAKEQLIMDAETHNKVIASLVQFARDQQQAPKNAKSTNNTRKK